MDWAKFNRAHDRLLDPPDDDDDAPGPDECDLADLYKQQQRDREDFEAERHRQRHEDTE